MKKKISGILFAVIFVLSVCACTDNRDLVKECYSYNLDEYISLGQYENIVIDVQNQVATEEEIQESIDLFLDDFTEYVELSGRTKAQNGDKVTISFTGTVNGEAKDGMSGSGTTFILGEGGFVPGFEDGIVGAEKGQIVEVNLTFPEEYYEDLKGKPAVFTVTVDELLMENRPQFNDDIVKAHTEYNTAEAYREHIAEVIVQDKWNEINDNFVSTVWDKILETTTILKYPDGMVDGFAQESRDYIEAFAYTQYGVSLETYIVSVCQTTMDVFEEEIQKQAVSIANNRLTLYAIVEKQGITLTQSEYEELAAEYVTSLGAESIEDIEIAYGKVEIITDMLLTKVQNLLNDTAKINVITD